MSDDDGFQLAQTREFLIDTEKMLGYAIKLLDEWDKRELALAIEMCGAEPVVSEGSFVDRVRRFLNDPKVALR